MSVQEYQSALSEYRIDPRSVDPEILDRHIPLLSTLDSLENSSIALMDMTTLEYRFLTRRLRFLLGFDPSEVRDGGMGFFLSLMNPQDLATFQDTSIQSFMYLMKRPAQERRDYKTCQDFRIRRADDSWIRLIQQLVVLELDKIGNIWLVLIITDMSPFSDLDVPSRRYMENLKTGHRVLFRPDEAEAKSPLSSRELEIIGLVSRGYHSRDIADYLGISVCTVNNHRQHILAKTQSANTAEALRYAMDLNLIG